MPRWCSTWLDKPRGSASFQKSLELPRDVGDMHLKIQVAALSGLNDQTASQGSSQSVAVASPLQANQQGTKEERKEGMTFRPADLYLDM